MSSHHTIPTSHSIESLVVFPGLGKDRTPDTEHSFVNEPGAVITNGTKVEYDFLLPKNPIDEIPIVIHNGFCAPSSVYNALAIGMAEEGRRVIRYHPPRHIETIKALLGGHIIDPLKKHSQAGHEVMKDVSRLYGYDQFDFLGHSMGTPIALQLAEHEPERVRSVMCTGGAGLDGGDSMISMGFKSVHLLRSEILAETSALSQHGSKDKVARDIASHILRDPIETLMEGYYVARVDSKDRLERVRDAGIRLGAILFEKDSFFDAQKVLEYVGRDFDFIMTVLQAKHIHPQLRPRDHAREQVAAFAILNAPDAELRINKHEQAG